MHSWRFFTVIFGLIIGASILIWRMIDLNIIERHFLLTQSNARVLRVISIPAYRGMITDRFNQPLAISAQVDSVWINPQLFEPSYEKLRSLSKLLKISVKKIQSRVRKDAGKEFLYLKRGIPPALTEQIKALEIPGIFYQHDYHRFYPQSDVAAHVVGFTNIDDLGQEGLELAYDTWLRGIPGKKKVLKDRLGNVIAELDILQPPRQGRDLMLSLDSRIQFLASEELKKSMQKFNAESGSIIVLDIRTGEVLAMVNQPSFNPNHIQKSKDGRYRNRAMTDMFEPGSTIKVFTVISALESGRYTTNSQVDTSPGWFTVTGNTIRDEHNCGILSLEEILQKSSDVGVAKIILALEPDRLWGLLRRVGFGERTTAFPGEACGAPVYEKKWRPFELATLSFGYGISVTAIQLAQAYAMIAAKGVHYPISLLKIDQLPAGNRVIDPKIATEMLNMLETVVQNGTGKLAKVPGYRIAGKTGTAYIAGPNGYDKHHVISSFVGIAPVSEPRVVVAVVIKDPRGEEHKGGLVAAPVFSNVMAGTLRLLNIAPDEVLLSH